MAPRQRRPRIEDVAQAAHVSVATVSRALRGLPNVAESTRYACSRWQRRCTTNRTRRPPGSPQDAREPSSSSSRTWRAGTSRPSSPVRKRCATNPATSSSSSESAPSPSAADSSTSPTGSNDAPTASSSSTSRPPMRRPARCASAAWRCRPSAPGPTGHHRCFIDDEEVGRLGATTLAELGHRRIGLISGLGEDPLNFEVPKRRTAGFLAGLAAAGLSHDTSLEVGGDFGIDGGQEAMSHLLDLDDPPTAVFAMSDEMAFGALMELKARGPATGCRRVGARRRRPRRVTRARADHDPPGRGLTGRRRGTVTRGHDGIGPGRSRPDRVADRVGGPRHDRSSSLTTATRVRLVRPDL